ncbi:MAG: hypothetical protein PCFJNLEI_00967 [Verrucomicrobiae bacterium]|nr:hypothetical protein [Verrucomicrobiae bacterium]
MVAFSVSVPGLLPGEKTLPSLTITPVLPALIVPIALRTELLVNTKPLKNVCVALLRMRSVAEPAPSPTTKDAAPGEAELIRACKTDVVPDLKLKLLNPPLRLVTVRISAVIVPLVRVMRAEPPAASEVPLRRAALPAALVTYKDPPATLSSFEMEVVLALMIIPPAKTLPPSLTFTALPRAAPVPMVTVLLPRFQVESAVPPATVTLLLLATLPMVLLEFP